MTGQELFWWTPFWMFPTVLLVIVMVLFALYLIFGRRGYPYPYAHFPEKKEETALAILKKRYALGEITKEEFVQMKKDILD